MDFAGIFQAYTKIQFQDTVACGMGTRTGFRFETATSNSQNHEKKASFPIASVD